MGKGNYGAVGLMGLLAAIKKVELLRGSGAGGELRGRGGNHGATRGAVEWETTLGSYGAVGGPRGKMWSCGPGGSTDQAPPAAQEERSHTFPGPSEVYWWDPAPSGRRLFPPPQSPGCSRGPPKSTHGRAGVTKAPPAQSQQVPHPCPAQRSRGRASLPALGHHGQ